MEEDGGDSQIENISERVNERPQIDSRSDRNLKLFV